MDAVGLKGAELSASPHRRLGEYVTPLVYLALAVGVFSGAWSNPAGRWIGEAQDPQLFLWYLAHLPHQLARGNSPLFTTYLNYPDGANLMWNSSIIAPSLVLWPVTVLFGPVVAYNVLVTLAVAGSAWLASIAARLFVSSRMLAFVAGLIYGFSPGMMAQATQHAHALIILFPPFALLLGAELLVRQRWRPGVAGLVAGVVASLQLLTGEEVLAVTMLIAAMGAGLLGLMFRGAVRARLPYLARAGGVAVIVFMVLCAYPLWVQFFGAQRVFGQLQGADLYVTDLVAFIVPNHTTLLQTDFARSIVDHLTGNPSEDNAYLGVPLLALFAAGVTMGWRRAPIRWVSLVTLLVALLSLGPHLHLAGWVSPVPLPWALLSGLPLFHNILPGRLMLIAFLGVGIVVAALAARLSTAERWLRPATWAAVAVALLLMVPEVPFVSTDASVPAFFKAGGEVARVTPGSVALLTPFSNSNSRSTEAMYWQATSNFRFRMPEGDAFSAGPYLGPAPTSTESILDQLDDRNPVVVAAPDRDRVLGELQQLRVTTVIVGPSPGHAAIVNFFTTLLGAPPVTSGGVDVWWDCCSRPLGGPA